MNYSNILIKPLITEKTLALSKSNKYTFMVNLLANKEDVKLAVKKLYGFAPLSVRITRYTQHKRRVNYIDPSKGSPKKKIVHYKKAVIQLGTDEKLDYFDIEQ